MRKGLCRQQKERLFTFSALPSLCVWRPQDTFRCGGRVAGYGRIMKWREGCRKREPVKQTSFTTAAKTNRGGPAPRVIYLSLNVNLNAHLAALFYPAPRLLLICFFLFLHCDSPEIIFTWMSRKGSTRALLLLQPACLRQLLTWVRDGGTDGETKETLSLHSKQQSKCLLSVFLFGRLAAPEQKPYAACSLLHEWILATWWAPTPCDLCSRTLLLRPLMVFLLSVNKFFDFFGSIKRIRGKNEAELS